MQLLVFAWFGLNVKTTFSIFARMMTKLNVVSVWQISFSLSRSTSALALLAASIAKKKRRGGLSSQQKYVDTLVFTAFESAGVALDCRGVSAGGLKSTVD